MNLDEIDRALREDRTIAPAPDFTGRVMRSVRQKADEREALAFPWSRFAWGLGTCAVLTVVGVIAAWLSGGSALAAPDVLVEVLERSSLVAALAWVPTALAGSLALVWSSLRFAGYR